MIVTDLGPAAGEDVELGDLRRRGLLRPCALANALRAGEDLLVQMVAERCSDLGHPALSVQAALAPGPAPAPRGTESVIRRVGLSVLKSLTQKPIVPAPIA